MTERKRAFRSFLADLKRRKVYRAAILYVVVAAGVVELADIVVPYTRLPESTVGIVFAIALFGFPLVLVLAWAYDVRPPRFERAQSDDDPEDAADGTATRVGPAAPAAAGDVASEPAGAGAPVGAEAAPEPPGSAPRREPDPTSLAVLPFDNLSGTDAVAPLAAGLHGDLLTALAKVPGLTVISRRSVMGYRETVKRSAEIARELNVGTLLEGAVQSAAGRVRLNVELIDPRQETQRWAESYDRELSPENIFQIQTELTRRIATSLHAQLGAPGAGPDHPATGRPSPRPPTADLEAYRLYSRGQSWLDHRTADALVRALEAFRAAIDLDPDYALAWAGLAEALALLRWYDYQGPDDAPDPDHAARRALELDPGLAEAYTSLGILHALRQDAPASRAALRRAADLGPSYAEAHVWLSWVLLVLGRAEDALEPARRALELNPLSPVVRVFTAETFLANGRPDEAREQSRRAIGLQGEFGLAHYMRALAAYHLGELDEAGEALARARSLVEPGGSSPRPTEVVALLALTHAAAGHTERALEQLEAIRAESADGAADPFAEGLVLAALGEVDGAFEAFGRVGRWGPVATEAFRYFFPRVLGPVRADDRSAAVLADIDRSWKIGG